MGSHSAHLIKFYMAIQFVIASLLTWVFIVSRKNQSDLKVKELKEELKLTKKEGESEVGILKYGILATGTFSNHKATLFC